MGWSGLPQVGGGGLPTGCPSPIRRRLLLPFVDVEEPATRQTQSMLPCISSSNRRKRSRNREIAASTGDRNRASAPRWSIHPPGSPYPPRPVYDNMLNLISESHRTRSKSPLQPRNAGLEMLARVLPCLTGLAATQSQPAHPGDHYGLTRAKSRSTYRAEPHRGSIASGSEVKRKTRTMESHSRPRRNGRFRASSTVTASD